MELSEFSFWRIFAYFRLKAGDHKKKTGEGGSQLNLTKQTQQTKNYHEKDLLEVSVVGDVGAGVGEQGGLDHVLSAPNLPAHIPAEEALIWGGGLLFGEEGSYLGRRALIWGGGLLFGKEKLALIWEGETGFYLGGGTGSYLGR